MVEEVIKVNWMGPYSWPKFEHENGLPPIPKHSGVYLQAFEYLDGYLIYAAGLTRRSISKRFSEHTRKYISGDYTVFDMVAMRQGIRKEIWHGWGWSPEKREAFEQNKEVIQNAVQEQLARFRIFVADVETRPRLLERLEASIMDALYQQAEPLCNIPDKGMMLAPRWDSESPIVIENNLIAHLYGIPSRMKI